MKRSVLTITTLLACAVSQAAFAANDGKWLVRVRALGVMPQESSTITPIGGKAKIDDSVVPELDVSYFFTPNIAAELIAATAKHDVTVKGSAAGSSVNAGSAWLLPPTLTLQYHFTQHEKCKPYIGAGVNYTVFYNENSGVLANVKYDNSWGYALQAGVDVPLRDSWYFNVDVKKLWLDTTAKFNDGAIRADVNLDPWLIGVGVGYRF